MKKSRVVSVLIVVMVMLIATLAACSTDVSYKINFEVDGTQFTSINTSGGEAISLPTAPTKEGFAFDGWYFDKDVWEQPLTINSFLDKKLTSDTTVYANWKINSYTVTFETSGGLTIPSQTIEYNRLANQPTAPTKTGFSFGGWFKDASFATAFDFSADKITANTTIYAKWLDIFDLTFEANGGSAVDTQKITDGNFANQPTAPTKVGFSFGGWFKDANFAMQFDFATDRITADTIIYAKWKINSYTVTFETSGGLTIPSQIIEYNSLANQPTAPTKTDFIFVGWFKEASFATQFNFADKITADTTIYAKWVSVDECFTFTFTDSTNSAYSVAKKSGATLPEIIALPAEYKSKPVVAINEAAFASCSSLTSVSIPASVTSIGLGAFGDCISLTSIIVDGGNTKYKSIDGNLYSKDGATLIQYAIGKTATNFTITANVTTIDGFAFYKCSSLKSVSIPASVTSIGLGAFGNCSSLTSVTVESGSTNYKSIDGNMYSKDGATLIQYAVGKKETIFIIPANVTTIGGYAFCGCTSLTSITIPASATFIGNYAFEGCSSLIINAEAASQPVGWNSWWNPSNCQVNWGYKNITANADYDYVTHNNEVYLTKYKGKALDAVIPATIDGKAVVSFGEIFKDNTTIKSLQIPASVTSIGSSAFYGCSSLTSVTFEAGSKLLSIGNDAFRCCSGLKSIAIPASVTIIGSSAFYGCSGLKSVTFEAGSKLTTIGEHAFDGCSGLKSITIPASVTSIGGSAFYGCSSLASVTFEAGSKLTTIGEYAFDGCSGLKSIAIPASVTSIGGSAFYNCKALTSITFEIESKLLSIGNDAFRGCIALTDITIPASVLSIGLAAFCCVEITADGKIVPSKLTNITVDSGNKNYKSIDGNLYSKDGSTLLQYAVGKTETSFIIPASVTSIGSSAFYGSGSLTSVTIPASVTIIGSSAFEGCSSLTSITISAGVTSIGWYAFSGCNSLTIYAETPSKPAGWDSSWNPSNCPVVWNSANNIIASDGNIYAVLDGIRYALKDGNATVIKQSSTITTANIPVAVTFNNVTYIVKTIEGGAFENCSSLTSVTFKAGSELTTIGYKSFNGCSKLISVTFEAGSKLTTIGEHAFDGCSGLTNITIPASVTTIGNYAFYNCKALTSVTFEVVSKLLSIGNDAFRGCTALTSITIPASVTTIGDYICFGCTSLTSVSIPASVTTIGEYAFNGCSSLTSVTVDSGNTKYKSIDGNLYSKDGATLIQYAVGKTETSFTIPASVTAISNFAFSGCSSLTSVTFEAGNKLTTIKGNAFENCNKLTSIAIPASVTTISAYAFYNCTALTEITIPAGVTTISDYAFYNCSSLISVKFDARSKLTTIDHYAFYKCSSLTSLTFPASVKSIGDYACFGCSSLTSVTIPISVITIGSSAFEGCSSLIINAEAASKPAGWDSRWNPSNCQVNWGHKI